MMFIIADKDYNKAVEYLIDNTNKNYCFKQLLELSQLLASCGYTNQMKPIKQGKDLQQWIKQNKAWTYNYYKKLHEWVKHNINLSPTTRKKFNQIETDIACTEDKEIVNAIFRYKQGYPCLYETNSLLGIDKASTEYKKYIETYKFKKS